MSRKRNDSPVEIDLWYGNKLSEVTEIDCSFSDVDCMYRGNMYINGKPVGDYSSYSSIAIEHMFEFLNGGEQ